MLDLDMGAGSGNQVGELKHAGRASCGYDVSPCGEDIIQLPFPDTRREPVVFHIEAATGTTAPVGKFHLHQPVSC